MGVLFVHAEHAHRWASWIVPPARSAGVALPAPRRLGQGVRRGGQFRQGTARPGCPRRSARAGLRLGRHRDAEVYGSASDHDLLRPVVPRGVDHGCRRTAAPGLGHEQQRRDPGPRRTPAGRGRGRTAAIVSVTSTCRNSVTCGAVNALETMARPCACGPPANRDPLLAGWAGHHGQAGRPRSVLYELLFRTERGATGRPGHAIPRDRAVRPAFAPSLPARRRRDPAVPAWGTGGTACPDKCWLDRRFGRDRAGSAAAAASECWSAATAGSAAAGDCPVAVAAGPAGLRAPACGGRGLDPEADQDRLPSGLVGLARDYIRAAAAARGVPPGPCVGGGGAGTTDRSTVCTGYGGSGARPRPRAWGCPRRPSALFDQQPGRPSCPTARAADPTALAVSISTMIWLDLDPITRLDVPGDDVGFGQASPTSGSLNSLSSVMFAGRPLQPDARSTASRIRSRSGR